MKRDAVLFLEPKGPALEVLRSAINRGFEAVVVTCDRTTLNSASEPYASALLLVTKFVVIEWWTDANETVQVVKALENEYKFVGVYHAMDPCAVTASILRKRYDLPATSPSVMETVVNKFKLRRRLHELGLSNLRNFHESEINSLDHWPFDGAAYFKPVHGFFSAYVSKCRSIEDCKNAKADYQKNSAADPAMVRSFLGSTGQFHLEEEFRGELLSVEGICQNGNFKCLGILSRILYSKDPVVEMGSCFPYPHELASEIVDYVETCHRSLGITEGPTHTELIVSPDGRIEIIDLNPRFVGADVMQSINRALGTQIQEVLLDYALGREVTLPTKIQKYSCLQYFLPPDISRFKSVEYPTCDNVEFTSTFLKPGADVGSNTRQLDYVGCYLTTGASFDGAIQKSYDLRPQVLINGSFQGEF